MENTTAKQKKAFSFDLSRKSLRAKEFTGCEYDDIISPTTNTHIGSIFANISVVAVMHIYR